MPSKSILCHTVRLFNYIGEVNDEAVYQEVIIKNCHCSIGDASKAGNSGTKASDSAKLYIFKRDSAVRSPKGVRLKYLPPEKWDKLSEKSRYWTINPGRDYFIRSDRQERIKVTSVVDREVGNQSMWHYEVSGK